MESTTTRTLGRGGLSFKTENGWRSDAPLSIAIVDQSCRLELIARVVSYRRGICSVEFSKARGALPDLAPLGEDLGSKLRRLDRMRQLRLPILLRLPCEDVRWFTFRFKRASLTGLDSLGGFVLSRLRPELGAPAILTTRRGAWRNRVEKIEGAVVRHGKSGFGVEFAGDAEIRRRFYRALTGR